MSDSGRFCGGGAGTDLGSGVAAGMIPAARRDASKVLSSGGGCTTATAGGGGGTSSAPVRFARPFNCSRGVAWTTGGVAVRAGGTDARSWARVSVEIAGGGGG